MKRIILVVILALFCTSELSSQQRRLQQRRSRAIIDGDTVLVVDLPTVPVFAVPIDRHKHRRLIRNVKVAYPIAKEASKKLNQVETNLKKLGSRRAQNRYLERVEDELVAEYTPVLSKMTYSQGKVLIKLIDRETQRSSYTILRSLRGNFSAFFWQATARLFGANLKEEYDKEGDDALIEKIIILYEAGVL